MSGWSRMVLIRRVCLKKVRGVTLFHTFAEWGIRGHQPFREWFVCFKLEMIVPRIERDDSGGARFVEETRNTVICNPIAGNIDLSDAVCNDVEIEVEGKRGIAEVAQVMLELLGE